MLKLETNDGRPVKVFRADGDEWLTVESVSVHGRDFSWRVPPEALAEFLDGLADGLEVVDGGSWRLDVEVARLVGA